MLAFITTLRHPQNSVDYGRVEKLLLDTLDSVARQSAEAFVIIIVGNKKPDFALPTCVRFVGVDFAPPAPPTGAKTAREPFVWDKGTKLGIGLIAAAEFEPTHVMFFDADDFVHRDLAATVERHRDHSGWVIRHGWKYSRARNCFVAQPNFNTECGTSFIIPFEAYGVPRELTTAASQEEVANAYGERLFTIMGAHRDAESWYRSHGRQIADFPFPAAVYHVDTGENHSGISLRGFARPFNTALRRDFGIRPSRGRLSTLWSAGGPAALLFEWRHLRYRMRTRRASTMTTGSRDTP
ncbi:MAG: glycosyltransferase family A protein [Beijerinckiaceae bacterium]|nr:glycosyltransferase family A protein [Beijerinckiaceae bacterium]